MPTEKVKKNLKIGSVPEHDCVVTYNYLGSKLRFGISMILFSGTSSYKCWD